MKYGYRLNDEELRVAADLEQIPAVDCHEHLCSEARRVAGKVDFLTLFSHYCYHDMLVAGMSEAQRTEMFRAPTAAEKWKLFRPVYENIRYSCYARAAHIALEYFYGETELRDDNVEKISADMQAANKPGLYTRVFRDACNIKTALVQNGDFEDRLGGLMTHVRGWMGNPNSYGFLQKTYAPILGRDILTLDDAADAVKKGVWDAKARGAAGVKTGSMPRTGATWSEANALFRQLKASPEKEIYRFNVLNEFLDDIMVREAGKAGLVVCVHTGYWSDYRELAPQNLIPLVDGNPGVKFDVYHLGYPYLREAIMLAKSHPNVWTNFAWTYIISQKFAADAMEEMLDMVPVNKIFAFGADYHVIEKVFGHMVMCRETLSRVLCKKIREGFFTYEQAMGIAEKLLHKNAESCYGLTDL